MKYRLPEGSRAKPEGESTLAAVAGPPLPMPSGVTWKGTAPIPATTVWIPVDTSSIRTTLWALSEE